MSSPRLAPWLIPDRISSGSDSTSPSAAKRTQSTGVPSVANPAVPLANSTSSTERALPVVMLRAVALRLESGAITASSTPGAPHRLGAGIERVAVELVAPVGRPVALVGALLRACQDAVAIGAAAGVPARVEGLRSGIASHHAQIGRQARVKGGGGCRVPGVAC